MAGDRELVLEVDAERARELLGSDDPPALVDIREEYELQSGTIAGSEHIPMGEVGARLDPDRDRRLVLYCAHGNRSLRLAGAMGGHGGGEGVPRGVRRGPCGPSGRASSRRRSASATAATC